MNVTSEYVFAKTSSICLRPMGPRCKMFCKKSIKYHRENMHLWHALNKISAKRVLLFGKHSNMECLTWEPFNKSSWPFKILDFDRQKKKKINVKMCTYHRKALGEIYEVDMFLHVLWKHLWKKRKNFSSVWWFLGVYSDTKGRKSPMANMTAIIFNIVITVKSLRPVTVYHIRILRYQWQFQIKGT